MMYHLTLKHGSKVKSNTCKTFTEHDFLQVVFTFQATIIIIYKLLIA